MQCRVTADKIAPEAPPSVSIPNPRQNLIAGSILSSLQMRSLMSSIMPMSIKKAGIASIIAVSILADVPFFARNLQNPPQGSFYI